MFMAALADELRNVQKDASIRMQAGLQLKNCLASREEGLNAERVEVWKKFDPTIRDHIKRSALEALATETSSSRSAPQVVSTIAIAEIPLGLWPDVIPVLVQAAQAPPNEQALSAYLETLGYICADVDSTFLQPQANHILNAVIGGMRHASPDVKLVATKALLNAVEFCKANFEADEERHYIMQVKL